MIAEKIELEIVDLSSGGQGIAKHNGITVFVDRATIGDQVIAEIRETKPNYLKAKLINIRKPSAQRVKPACSHFGVCGSCQLQNLSYQAQLQYKQKRVWDALIRIGGLTEKDLPEIKLNPAPEPFYYRNKAQLPVSQIGKETWLGYYRSNSHQLVDLNECHLHHPDFMTAVLAFKQLVNESQLSIYNEDKHKGALRHFCLRVGEYTDEMQLTLVLNDKKPVKLALESFIEQLNQKMAKYQVTSILQNINTDKGNRIFGKKNISLYGQEYISEKVGGHFFRISPNTFLQVNLQQAENLYQGLADLLPPKSRTIIDLYCGIGTITLNISEWAQKIIGVEQNPQAVKDARQNSRNNNIENVEFLNIASQQLDFGQFLDIDAVIADPPRKGLDPELIDKLKSLSVKELFYISCNPATLARDLKALVTDGPYQINNIQLYDLFPQTTHIETLIRLTLTD